MCAYKAQWLFYCKLQFDSSTCTTMSVGKWNTHNIVLKLMQRFECIRRHEMPKPNGFLHPLCALRHRFYLCAFSEEENQLGKDGRVASIKEIRIRVSYHCARRHAMCAGQSRIYGMRGLGEISKTPIIIINGKIEVFLKTSDHAKVIMSLTTLYSRT